MGLLKVSLMDGVIIGMTFPKKELEKLENEGLLERIQIG
jgi:hypothetical protein